MIRIVFYISVICTCSLELCAQKDINLIISVDGNVVTGSLSRLRLIVSLQDGTQRTMEADYYPGNLSLNQVDYNLLLDTSVKRVFLVFDYSDRCNSNAHTYSYEIDLQKGWLRDYYYVLRIYNTDKRQYRKIYTPLEGKSYTYEYDYPGGSVNRIRKKNKENCN